MLKHNKKIISIDGKVTYDPETSKFIYKDKNKAKGVVEIRPLTELIQNYHNIEYSNLPASKLQVYPKAHEEFHKFLKGNNQVIVSEDVIIYDLEFNLADIISFITKRTYEDVRGLEHAEFYFYILTDYSEVSGRSGIYGVGAGNSGNFKMPFLFFKQTGYNIESVRAACWKMMMGEGFTIKGIYLLHAASKLRGEDIYIDPVFPMQTWVEKDIEGNEMLYARYPRKPEGRIYNTKFSKLEDVYLL